MKLLQGLGVVAIGAVLAMSGCSNAAPEQRTGAEDQPADSGAGDQGGAAKSDLTVAVVTHGQPGDSFWDIVKSGADQAGKDERVTVTYNGDGDPTKQSQLIDKRSPRRSTASSSRWPTPTA